jgi:hypothetical protein
VEIRLVLSLILVLTLLAAPFAGAVQLELFDPDGQPSCDADLTQRPELKSLAGLSERSRRIWTEQLAELGKNMRYGVLSHNEKTRFVVNASLAGLDYLEDGLPPEQNQTQAAERLLINLIVRIYKLGLGNEDVILPGFLFRTSEGKIAAKRYGTEIPEGWLPATADDFKSLLDSHAFTRLLAEGLQVIQVAQPEQMPETQAARFIYAQHDIGHLIGMAKSAEYMKAVRSVAKGRVRFMDLNRGAHLPAPPDPASFYIFEYFSHGDRAAIQEFFERLGIPEAYHCETVECVMGYLRDLKH